MPRRAEREPKPLGQPRKQINVVSHTIQVFSGGCRLCEEAAEIVELGKCKDCKMEVLKVDADENKAVVARFGIDAVPSIVIDGRIKVWEFPNSLGSAETSSTICLKRGIP